MRRLIILVIILGRKIILVLRSIGDLGIRVRKGGSFRVLRLVFGVRRRNEREVRFLRGRVGVLGVARPGGRLFQFGGLVLSELRLFILVLKEIRLGRQDGGVVLGFLVVRILLIRLILAIRDGFFRQNVGRGH